MHAIDFSFLLEKRWNNGPPYKLGKNIGLSWTLLHYFFLLRVFSNKNPSFSRDLQQAPCLSFISLKIVVSYVLLLKWTCHDSLRVKLLISQLKFNHRFWMKISYDTPVMLAWRKYELYNYTMLLVWVLLWSLYVYLLSLNTYEHMQHYKQSIRTPLCLPNSPPKVMNTFMYYL